MAIAVLVALLVASAVGTAQADAATFGARALKLGATGSDVKTLQKLLTDAGYATTADGHFGRGTKRNVKAWEGDAQRAVNGRVSRPDARALKAQVVQTAPAPRPSDDEAFAMESTGGAGFVQVEPATLNPDGTATAPASAPQAVKDIIAAGNEIAKKPYKYGGGHGKWKDSGYDCSGSVSYALHGAGLLKRALDSTGFMSWGLAGAGTWVTIYAHGGHAYMTVAGLRFDTSARKQTGSRWTDVARSPDGFTVRHPKGL